MSDEFKLDITGKVVVLIELADHGPMELSFNDKATALNILDVLINEKPFTVRGAYEEEQGTQFQSLLDSV